MVQILIFFFHTSSIYKGKEKSICGNTNDHVLRRKGNKYIENDRKEKWNTSSIPN